MHGDRFQPDYGILGAATGFGKTVIGAYLISQRKANTIVLVHNREIMKFKDQADALVKMLELKVDHVFLLQGGRSNRERDEITLNLSCEKQKTNAIFDAETYRNAYEADLSQANSEIVIASPGINSTKVKQLIYTVSNKQVQGVKDSVITIPSAEYPDNRIEPTKKLIDELREAGIYVKEVSGIHEHFAVIDKEIVWYGSMNMLSREKEDDNLMRVNSKEIADAL